LESRGHGIFLLLEFTARRAEVAAPSTAAEVRDALAPCVRILTRLFALVEARYFAGRAAHVLLSTAGVALDVVADVHPLAFAFRGGDWFGFSRGSSLRGRRSHPHGDGTFLFLDFGTRSAVEAAPAALEERDTLALFVAAARLLANANALHSPRRIFEVDLSIFRVAFCIGAD